MENLQEISYWIILAVGVIEIVGRAIPDKKWNGPIGHVVNVLKFVSDYLNRGRK